MAFKNGLSERLDELRFPSPRSPPSESSFPGYGPFPPNHSNLASAFPRPTGDVRSNIQRRFTTDSSKLSSWNYLNQGATQMPDPLDMLSSVSLDFSSYGRFYSLRFLPIFLPGAGGSTRLLCSRCLLFSRQSNLLSSPEFRLLL